MFDHFVKFIKLESVRELINILFITISDKIGPHYHHFFNVKLSCNAKPKQVLVIKPWIVVAEVSL